MNLPTRFRRRLALPRSRSSRVLFTGAVALLGLTLVAIQGEHGTSNAAAPTTPRAAAVASAQAATVPRSTTTATPSAVSGAADPGEGATNPVTPPEVPAESHAGRFTMPLKSWTKVTDRFGAPRAGGLIHGGIDLALDHHTPVYSACTGTVESTSYNSTYGNNVIIDCGDSYETLYGHLSQILVKTGDAADSSLEIGLSGSTGYSTGEHLHFEIRYQGIPVNPENFLDFHIAPGTPLSDGPIVFPGGGDGSGGAATNTEAPSPTDPATLPAPTNTPTVTPTATSTSTPTPTPTPTNTPTPTPRPRPRATPTPPLAY
ncbi:MAG: M23 family metallopeptidase [Tepidiformaceae bacterium]